MSTTNTSESILDAILNMREVIPAEELRAAEGFRNELAPRLAQWLERWVAGPKEDGAEACARPLCVLLLLASWGVREAFPVVVRWLVNAENENSHLHRMAVEFGPSVLASVWDGNLETLRAIAQDRTGPETVRGTALLAPVVACERGRLERPALHAWQTSLLQNPVFPKGDPLWAEFVSAYIRSGNQTAHPLLAAAYRSGLLPADYICPGEWEMAKAPPPEACELPVEDVAAEAAEWVEGAVLDEELFGFCEDDADDTDREDEKDDGEEK